MEMTFREKVQRSREQQAYQQMQEIGKGLENFACVLMAVLMFFLMLILCG
jgi:hypothetical protein